MKTATLACGTDTKVLNDYLDHLDYYYTHPTTSHVSQVVYPACRLWPAPLRTLQGITCNLLPIAYDYVLGHDNAIHQIDFAWATNVGGLVLWRDDLYRDTRTRDVPELLSEPRQELLALHLQHMVSGNDDVFEALKRQRSLLLQSKSDEF